MTWTAIDKPKHHLAHDDMQLRLIDKNNGYLDVGARAFLFDGERGGYLLFEEDSGSGMMSITSCDNDRTKAVHVPRSGRLSVRQITSRTNASLPISILLAPVNGEHRLLFAGVR
jgi:hypothetical protein